MEKKRNANLGNQLFVTLATSILTAGLTYYIFHQQAKKQDKAIAVQKEAVTQLGRQVNLLKTQVKVLNESNRLRKEQTDDTRKRKVSDYKSLFKRIFSEKLEIRRGAYADLINMKENDVKAAKLFKTRLQHHFRSTNDGIKRGRALQAIYYLDKDLTWISIYGESPIEGSDFYFIHADFSNAFLSGLKVTHSRFDRANFTNAKMEGAKLSNCTFYKAKFHRTDLSKGRLNQSDFSRTKFRKTNFKNANLNNTIWCKNSGLESSEFSFAEMNGVKIETKYKKSFQSIFLGSHESRLRTLKRCKLYGDL